MLERYLLEIELEGEITDEQDLIWLSKDIEVKDKLDSYGRLLDELAAEKKKLADIKASGVLRASEAAHRVEKLEQKLKSRLNLLSGGKPLRGHLYSFHPYESKKRTIDVEKLSQNEIYLTIEIRQDYWESLLRDSTMDEEVDFSVKKVAGKVSELSEEHPAVETVLTPSVRIT